VFEVGIGHVKENDTCTGQDGNLSAQESDNLAEPALVPDGISASNPASPESTCRLSVLDEVEAAVPRETIMSRSNGKHRILRLISVLVLAWASRAGAAPAPTFHEPWRPQFHFTAPDTWMNDPNGMLFYEGEYHLFYQNNPFGNRWGHMSWGHAVSRDLTHWEHLPLALAEADGVMIFSGSAVVDWKNTSGFGQRGKPPLVAIYTGHHTTKPLQQQHIAYSNDRGRTWTKFTRNPVLDIGEADFRDPKVFWHEATGRWVMAVSWPQKRKVRFYASPDLKSWTHLSDFGPAGSTTGIWECPDLFPVKAEGRGGGSRWVLVVNVGSGAPAGGSGTQYFVGEFDGTRFVPDTASGDPTKGDALWADFGPDFYAAVSWSDVPKRDGRRLWIGWMSNWTYANDVPTLPWRSAMTLPRELALRETPEGWRLLQVPVRETGRLRGPGSSLRGATVPGADAWLAQRRFPAGLAELELQFDEVPRAGVLTLTCRHGSIGETRVEADLGLADGRLSLRLLADVSSLEVFAQGGETVMTGLVLPASPGLTFSLAATEDARGLRVASVALFPLKPSVPPGSPSRP
jgi:fructan beta-fructosidase